jgi:hypothetical protein
MNNIINHQLSEVSVAELLWRPHHARALLEVKPPPLQPPKMDQPLRSVDRVDLEGAAPRGTPKLKNQMEMTRLKSLRRQSRQAKKRLKRSHLEHE